MIHVAKTEIAFLGVTRDPANPLHITDLYMPPQHCSGAYVELDIDEDVDLADPPVDHPILGGLQPWQYLNLWIHTHPGDSCTPSSKDESTFSEKFGHCSHACMIIMAQNHDVYCRLRTKHPHFHQTQQLKVTYEANPVSKTSLALPWIETWKARCRDFGSYNSNSQNKSYYNGYYGRDSVGVDLHPGWTGGTQSNGAIVKQNGDSALPPFNLQDPFKSTNGLGRHHHGFERVVPITEFGGDFAMPFGEFTLVMTKKERKQATELVWKWHRAAKTAWWQGQPIPKCLPDDHPLARLVHPSKKAQNLLLQGNPSQTTPVTGGGTIDAYKEAVAECRKELGIKDPEDDVPLTAFERTSLHAFADRLIVLQNSTTVEEQAAFDEAMTRYNNMPILHQLVVDDHIKESTHATVDSAPALADKPSTFNPDNPAGTIGLSEN